MLSLFSLSFQRIIHRDLSPRNVLLTEQCDAVIADFEASKDRELEASVALHSIVIAAARCALDSAAASRPLGP